MSAALWVATALTTGVVIGAAITAYLDRDRTRKLRDLIDWLGEGLEARKIAELRHATFEDPTARAGALARGRGPGGPSRVRALDPARRDPRTGAAMSRCRSCKAPVVWARTTKGKSIPLDAEDMGGWESPLHVADGNLQATGERVPAGAGQTAMVVRYVAPGEGDLRTHFSTCPDAASWRTKAAAS